jgi:hypothetical protein
VHLVLFCGGKKNEDQYHWWWAGGVVFRDTDEEGVGVASDQDLRAQWAG